MEVNCRAEPGQGTRIHVLVAFPPATTPDVIGRIFHGQTDLPGEAERSGNEEIVVRNMAEFSAAVKSAGGILILAHVDEQSRGHRSFVRKAIGENLEMLGIDPSGKEMQVEISEIYKGFLVDASPAAVEVRRSKDSEHYARVETPDGESHTIACVAQSDFHNVESFDRADAHTHIKVSRPDFDCVTEALKFRDTRIRFADELPAAPTPRIVGLRLRSPQGEGLFEELTVAFNENLNCAIGARGCGKSTMVEALRYVLGQRHLLGEAADDAGEGSFSSLALATGAANLAGTQIELIYETGEERHVLSATYDAESDCTTRVLTMEGVDCHVPHEAIETSYPALIFSWGELETLGREPRLQRVVVDRLSEKLPELAERLVASRTALAANREACTAARVDLDRISEGEGRLLHRFRDSKEKFERMNEPAVAELFRNLDEARARVRVLEELDQTLKDLLESIDGVDPTTPTATISALPAESLAWWQSGPDAEIDLDGLQGELDRGLTQLRAAVEKRRTSLERRLATERAGRDATEEELREKTQTDATTTIRGEQRETARRHHEEAGAVRRRYIEAFGVLEGLLAERAGLLDASTEIVGEIAATRQEVAGGLTSQLAEIGSEGPIVSIDVSVGGDRTALKDFLGRGFLNPERAGQWKSKNVPARLATRSPIQIAWSIIAREPTWLVGSGEDGLSNEQAGKLVDAMVPFAHDEDADVTIVDLSLDELLALQEQPIDDLVRIHSDGEPVDKLSPGGRSSAMLPLIALSDTAPLIIDQPEDNLDNRMVGNTLSSILAHLKERRQIIVTTHNPNIVVGGDAEQVIVLEALGDRSARLENTGNIDDEPVIDAVIKIMEGGREAFAERRRRYEPLL
jgi:energy-coupling factor transporter ATP-binding protein EcfA2